MKNEPVRSMTQGHLKEFAATLIGAIPELTFDQAEAVKRDKGLLVDDVRKDIERYAGLCAEMPLTPEQLAVGIVKTVTIQIAGGRTTDKMVKAAKRDCGDRNVNGDITQKNMPSGYGKLRWITLEFRQFDHEATSEEVADWQNEPGHGPSGYEDGLRFREQNPEDQRKQPHIFQPEAPWCDADGVPFALSLWGDELSRGVSLDVCEPRDQWLRFCLFARRKYLVTSVA